MLTKELLATLSARMLPARAAACVSPIAYRSRSRSAARRMRVRTLASSPYHSRVARNRSAASSASISCAASGAETATIAANETHERADTVASGDANRSTRPGRSQAHPAESSAGQSGGRPAEPRQVRGQGGDRRKLLLRMELLSAFEEGALRLHVVRIRDAAIHGADGGAGLFVMEADALGAEGRIDDEDVLALADGLVRAFGLAGAAIDAFLGDDRGHVFSGLPRFVTRASALPCRAAQAVARTGFA